MELILSSPTVKIFDKKDAVPVITNKCFTNQSYAFQVVVSGPDGEYPVSVKSDLTLSTYQVKKLKGDQYYTKDVDDFYVYSADGYYPELLQKTDVAKVCDGIAVLYFTVDGKKQKGNHDIEITVADEKISLSVEVLDGELADTDLMITNWLHFDGVSVIYNVKPFSDEFYKIFDKFMTAYVNLGNTMALVPMFTPPLDTKVGGERPTTQLVKVKKRGLKYEFDLSDLDRYIDFCISHGIKYFELSHIFTQWGGKFCPKIIADVKGEEKRIFGWDVKSTSLKYKNFIKQFLGVLVPYLKNKGVFDKCVMHLTDEPTGPHVKRYSYLAKFVKKYNGGIPVFDALSHFDFFKSGAVDLPAVSIGSSEYHLFNNREILAYYCCCEHKNYLTNRYFHMPLCRTETLGVLLYVENVLGFLHWGYNFYNKRWSISVTDPYTDTTAGDDGFPAGDSFLVYPGETDVEYSIRYFSIKRAFEDYRLLKTLENKIGRDAVLKIVNDSGFKNKHEYPHDEDYLQKLRETIYSLI